MTLPGPALRQVTSCGVALVRETPQRELLWLRAYGNFDLPKGVLEAGEAERAGALRELSEEAGIPSSSVELDPDFRFTARYPSRSGGAAVEKVLVVFLGRLLHDAAVRLSAEHHSYAWVPLADRRALRQIRWRDLVQRIDERLREIDARR
jgi:bis(5'-nucleosidyl)-tetraphosphatase